MGIIRGSSDEHRARAAGLGRLGVVLGEAEGVFIEVIVVAGMVALFVASGTVFGVPSV